MGIRVFISYRRGDSKHEAKQLYDAFARQMPRDEVFWDIDSIPAGTDFSLFLKAKVDECEILLALIGPDWINVVDPTTKKRRLDDPNDYVRLEIGRALARNVRVVPVLIDNAPLPSPDQLPEELKNLALRNAEFINFRSFDRDVQHLFARVVDPSLVVGQDYDSLLDRYVVESIPDNARRAIEEEVRIDLLQHGWRLDSMGKGAGCTNPTFNLLLFVNPPIIPYRVIPGHWLARERYSKDLWPIALSHAQKKPGDIFNAQKIRVAGDFVSSRSSDVPIQETDYISSLMTDQIAWMYVRSRKLSADGETPEIVLWDGISAFIARNRSSSTSQLKALGEAEISNQLGGSTLAFSNDGHLLIVYQAKTNLQSDNLLAPSGSGSLDWADVAASNASDFLGMARYGAERELREECALDDDGTGRRRIDSKVMVTGFARMLHRGGKPEVYCLARIGARFLELNSRARERYVERVLKATVNPADLHCVHPRYEVMRVCEEYLTKNLYDEGRRMRLSYPLEHSLKLLIEACRDESAGKVVDRFFRDEF